MGSSEIHNSLYTKITTKNTTKSTTESESKKRTATADIPTPPTAKKPNGAKKSKSAKTAKFDPRAYPIGDCVDMELWCDFVAMREAIKKPLTEVACKHLVKDFTAWANEGLSPNLAICHSIKNGYQGVFKERAVMEQVPCRPQATAQATAQAQRQQTQAHDFTQYLNLHHTPPPNAFDGIVIDGDCQ